jgi:hypothetical protein
MLTTLAADHVMGTEAVMFTVAGRSLPTERGKIANVPVIGVVVVLTVHAVVRLTAVVMLPGPVPAPVRATIM